MLSILMRLPHRYRSILLVLFSLWPLHPYANSVESIEPPLTVAVAVPPIAMLVDEIGGSSVKVSTAANPNQDPHLYEPSPKQIATLSRAALYLYSGLGFEERLQRQLLSLNPEMNLLKLLSTDNHQNPIDAGSHHHDPHFWTSPKQMMLAGLKIKEQLQDLLPTSLSAGIENNYQRLQQRLQQLDMRLSSIASDSVNRRFLAYHPAWGNLAEDYGFTQMLIEDEGKNPGPRRMTLIIKEAQKHGIKRLIIRPQQNRHLAEQVAASIGVTLVTIDPLAYRQIEEIERLSSYLQEIDHVR